MIRVARFLRGALSGIFFVSYGVAALPAAVLLLPPVWPRFAVRFAIRWFYRVFVFFAAATGLFRVCMDAETRRALAGCRGRIVAMNHLSLLDVVVLMAFLGDSTAIAKAGAAKNPFLGMVVRRMFITNGQDAAKTLADAKRCLDAGVNVIVFPEGTRRRPTDAPAPIHRGVARLALSCGAPVQAFHAEYRPLVLAKGQPWWDVGARTIRIVLSQRGVAAPQGESNHRNAVALTRRIGEMIA